MSVPSDNYIGEPGYPAPWTTKTPREGLRDIDEAKIVSLSPDVCLTPIGSSVVPIPYPIVDFCGHDEGYTPSVRFTGKKAMVMRSCTTHVHGDKPGIRKGRKSGTVESICEPIGHADQVRAEGSNVIRHLDRFWMNNRNTEGEAIFVRSTQTYDPPIDDDPVPGSLRWEDGEPVQLAYNGSTAEAFMLGEGGAATQQAAPRQTPMQSPSPATRTVPNPVPRPPGTVISPSPQRAPQWHRSPPVPEAPLGKWLGRLGKFGRVAGPVAAFVAGMWPTSTAMPWHDEMPQDDFEEALFKHARELERQGVNNDAISEWFDGERLHHAQRKREEERKPQAIPRSENVHVDEDENQQKCPWIVICFMPRTRSKYSLSEFQKQLSEQEAALQTMAPQRYITNRGGIIAAGTTDVARNSPRAKLAYRQIWNGFDSENPGTSHEGLAALHALDIVAGGDPANYLRIGPQRENGIIGALWSQSRGVKGGDRLQRLDAHAARLQANGCPVMNARLRVCPGRGSDVTGAPL